MILPIGGVILGGPGKVALKLLPQLLDAAVMIFNKWKNAPKPEVDLKADMTAQLTAVVERIQRLETGELEQANLVKQIVEQLQVVSNTLVESSQKAQFALLLGVGAFVLSVAALIVALLR